jgi:large subunit ribosomal protein L31e
MKVERIYTIPLGDAYEAVSYKRTPRAVKIIREFVARHMKARNGEKISMSTNLNEFLWMRSIKKPPRRVKVRIIKDGALVNVYLSDEKIAEKKEATPTETKKEAPKTEAPAAVEKPAEVKKVATESKPTEKKVAKSEKK